jgi:hypothetical protein
LAAVGGPGAENKTECRERRRLDTGIFPPQISEVGDGRKVTLVASAIKQRGRHFNGRLEQW